MAAILEDSWASWLPGLRPSEGLVIPPVRLLLGFPPSLSSVPGLLLHSHVGLLHLAIPCLPDATQYDLVSSYLRGVLGVAEKEVWSVSILSAPQLRQAALLRRMADAER